MVTFRGFSTVGKRFGNFVLEDKELAKRDLLNHFYTRKGERLGEPEFGSILPELIFEQLDDATIELVEEDVISVVSTDPRWQFQDVRVILEDHSIECEIQLIYLTDGTADQLYLKYTSEEEI
jgi:phage baseplate assembly protein W